MAEKLETYEQLNAALDGDVVVDIGQVGPLSKKALKQAVRAGMIVTWRGKWFPVAGAAFGMGPDKTCWGTPETYAQITGINAAMTRAA